MSRLASMVMVLLAATGGDQERGIALYRQGDFTGAVAAFRAALVSEGDSPELQWNLALAHFAAGELDDAEKAAEKYAATASEPRRDWHAGMLGAVRHAQAQQQARSAMAIDAAPPPEGAKPNDPVAALKRALTTAQQARDYYVRAGEPEPTPELVRNLERAQRLIQAIEQVLKQQPETKGDSKAGDQQGQPKDEQKETEKKEKEEKEQQKQEQEKQSPEQLQQQDKPKQSENDDKPTGEGEAKQPEQPKQTGEQGDQQQQQQQQQQPQQSQPQPDTGNESGDGKPQPSEQPPSGTSAANPDEAPEPASRPSQQDPHGDPKSNERGSADPAPEPGSGAAPKPSSPEQTGDAAGKHTDVPGRELTREEAERLLRRLHELDRQMQQIRLRNRSARTPVERDW